MEEMIVELVNQVLIVEVTIEEMIIENDESLLDNLEDLFDNLYLKELNKKI